MAAGNEKTGRLTLSWAGEGSASAASKFAAVAALAAVLYASVFASLVSMWWGSDDYNHGFLVPVLAACMAWAGREALIKLDVRPNMKAGVPLALLAGALLIAGKAGSVIVAQELSFIVMLFALTALVLGTGYLRQLALPMLYLLFMIKIFGQGSERLHWPLQLLAANIGTLTLHTLGYQAFQEAQYIQLPSITLEVASACSGMRFLVSIIAIGIPLAYFTQRTMARRVALVAFGITVAILSNGLRVALIGLWAYHGGKVVHGPMHTLQGVFVSWAGFAALFAGAWALSRKNKSRTDEKEQTDPITLKRLAADITGKAAQCDGWTRSWGVACGLLVLFGGAYYLHRVNQVPLEAGLQVPPIEIGSWHGARLDADANPLRVERADAEVSRTYENATGQKADFYIGYFGAEDQAKALVNYRTSWKFHRGEEVIEINSQGRACKVNRVVLKENGKKRLVLFWYSVDGRVEASRIHVKLLTAWNSFRHGRTNGALFAVSVPVEGERDINAASRDLAKLAGGLIAASAQDI